MTLAEVLLPLPLNRGTFTYEVPESMATRVKPGVRVIVPFGSKKFYTGIVIAPGNPMQQGVKLKAIERVLDGEPMVIFPQYKFWEWLADYYLCTPGEVYRAAMPSGLKLESETVVELDYDSDSPDMADEQALFVVASLRNEGKPMAVSRLGQLLGTDNIVAVLSRMMEAGVVRVSERIVERFHARRVAYVVPAIERGNARALEEAFVAIGRARKQEHAFLTLLEMSGFMRRDGELKDVTRASLMERAEVSGAIVNVLVKRGLVRVETRTVRSFEMVDVPDPQLPELSPAQSEALNAIHASWLERDVTLLHGVTSSGKTEIYIHLIDYVLKQKRQALFLVPEIALTTQLTRRLQRVFGSRVVIYHSKFSDGQRVETWCDLIEDRSPRVIIGARSAVFLPFADLGLVIVDEEHETSYKQQDPAPRYNARDAATVLARMHGAKTLLASATPAIDTYYKARSGRFGLVSLTERYSGVAMPKVRLIDMTRERQHGRVKGPFSYELREMVREARQEQRQSIIFLNRRGYAPVARCKMCGHVPKCTYCDVSLTFHKRDNRLVCHYCGTQYPMLQLCPACGEPSIEIAGYGTERIEDETAEAFEGASIVRMDLDTTRNKDGYEKIITDFSQGSHDILVGTQMVTKGLDFERVAVVGVVNADAMIHIPDFRSSERAFNMMSQVAGRAGRRAGSRGEVAIQTWSPDTPLFKPLMAHDYEAFYEQEIAERQRYTYPPFSRLIYVYIKHVDAVRASAVAAEYARRLRLLFGNRVFGPDEPAVARVQNLFIRRIMLKVETNASMTKVKALMRELYEQMVEAKQLSGVRLYYDVDPM